jgi:predicted flavoprotein YhiN
VADVSGGRLPIVVVGAGAAGVMAAIFAADAGAPVLLLERTRDGGRKILISGGGRCNVLPSRMDPSQYFTASSPNTRAEDAAPGRLRSSAASSRKRWGCALALEPETGKLFPASNRARDVRDGLLALATRRGATTRFDTLRWWGCVRRPARRRGGCCWRAARRSKPRRW